MISLGFTLNAIFYGATGLIFFRDRLWYWIAYIVLLVFLALIRILDVPFLNDCVWGCDD